jgi:anti-anti-sigma regulatory factor
MLLVAPQPQVERTMRLLGLDELPGVEIVGGEQ